MNRRRALSLAIVVASCSAIPVAAQTPATPFQLPGSSAPEIRSAWPGSLDAAESMQTGCPVGLRAQRGTGSGMLVARGSRDHAPTTGVAQQLHMTFTNRMPTNVVGVTLTAHGLTATSRLTPTVQSAAASPSGTITRTIHLDVTLDPRANVSADLTLEAFTSVSRIDVDAIDYADGSSWHASAQQRCHIAPDGLMLVSSR
jgi:hypothetical protein